MCGGGVAISPRDQLVILASDGLWDVVDDAEAVRIALESGRRAAAGGAPTIGATRSVAPQAAADALLKRALDLGSMDNVTVLVVWFNWDS